MTAGVSLQSFTWPGYEEPYITTIDSPAGLDETCKAGPHNESNDTGQQQLSAFFINQQLFLLN